jgi:signal transduction histidine kinase
VNRLTDVNLIAAPAPSGISSSTAAADVWQSPSGSARTHRGLFRKYLLLFIGLVGAALLINAAIEFAFVYRENQSILARLRGEKADAAAQRIAQFIGEIERQVGWTTQGQWAAGSVDQRRFDYVRLLRQVPAITELRQLDAAGKEQLKVSRLAMDVVASGTDFSHDALFSDALIQKTSFSPVSFRNESEPYFTIAIAGSGRNPGVTLADVNLKLIWDVIRSLQIGRNGYAYVVDRHGRLIAHPDISMVLRNTSFAMLPQVAAGLREMGVGTPGVPPDSLNTNGPGISNSGQRMMSAHATLPALGWLVFVELPRAEALEPLYEAAMRTATVLLGGLVLAALVALFMVRRMVGPIRLLQAGAARIGAGDLDSRINVRTGDELESLADQFNIMAGQLQQSYSGLERKVADRTEELHESLKYQTAISDVLRVMSQSITDIAPALQTVVEMAVRLCRASQASIFELENGVYRWKVGHGLNAAYRDIEAGSDITVGSGTLVGRVAATGHAVHIADALADPGYGPTDEARIGIVRSMLGIPLLRERVPVGVITIARAVVEPFTDREVEMLTVFADQAVIAIENVRLFREIEYKSVAAEEASRTIEAAYRELKAAQANLIQAEKMASLGQLTAGIAHEIKNPLNFVNNFAILSVELLSELKETIAPALALLDEHKRADIEEVTGMLTSNLEKIAEHGRRADGIVRSMLEHSRSGSGERRAVDLNSLVEEAMNLAYHGARAQHRSFNITLERDFGTGIAPIELTPQDVTRVFLNLFSNGFYATDKRARSGAGSEFEPTLKVTTRSLDDGVEVRVWDNGSGIPAEIRDKLFQPFFTTKPTGEGTGLGLSITYDIVTQQHGGTITVKSEVDKFTEFVVTLPRRVFASDGGRA